ncbi:lame duck isoform 2-T2 [Cochliomyia hominivorax]
MSSTLKMNNQNLSIPIQKSLSLNMYHDMAQPSTPPYTPFGNSSGNTSSCSSSSNSVKLYSGQQTENFTTLSPTMTTGAPTATAATASSVLNCNLMSPPLSATPLSEHFRASLCNLKSFNSGSNYNDFATADAHFPDFSQLTFAAVETPSSIYGGNNGIGNMSLNGEDYLHKRHHSMCYSGGEEEEYGHLSDDDVKCETMQQEQQQSQQDVFRFEPEDIARLSETCQYEDINSVPIMPQTPFTPQTPYTPYPSNYMSFTPSTTHQTQHQQQQEHNDYAMSFTNNNTNTQQMSMSASMQECQIMQEDPANDCLNLDIEYYNYNEINCQSKEQSPCSSPPLDPWMSLNLSDSLHQPARQESPKILNTSYAGFTPPQQINYEPSIKQEEASKTKLPSMMSTFGTPKYEPLSAYSYNDYSECQQRPHIYSPPAQASSPMEASGHYTQNLNSFNVLSDDFENCNMLNMDKPNREHKIIWTINELDEINEEMMSELCRQPLQNHNGYETQQYYCNNDNSTNTDEDEENNFELLDEVETFTDGLESEGLEEENDEVFVVEKVKPIKPRRKRCISQTSNASSTVNSAAATITGSELEQTQQEPMICRWTDCNEIFPNQAEFVAHIEKRHVDVKRGEDFSCFWHECPRRYKPFNARYKLLIHMRVHSGEKPNKCPKPYACQLPGCTKRYTDPSSLRKHVKNHALRNANGHLGRRKSSSAATTTSTTTSNNNKKSNNKTRRHSESSLMQTNKTNKNNTNNCNNNMQPQEIVVTMQHGNQNGNNKQRSNSFSEISTTTSTNNSINMAMVNNNYENKQKLTNVNYNITTNNKLQQQHHNNNQKHMLPTTLKTEPLLSPANHNSMNFNELSNCIVTIEQYNCNNNNKNNHVENDVDKNHSDQNSTTATTALAAYNLGNNTTAANKNDSNENINQLNDFQQLLQVKSSKCQQLQKQQMNVTNISSCSTSATLTCDVLNYNSTSSTNTITTTNNNNNYTKYVMSNGTTTTANGITTNSISTQSHNNINSTAATTTTGILATPQNQNIVTTITATTADDNDDTNEFVSFEYVKKLLSETFDYMDEDGATVADNGSSCCDNNIQNTNSAPTSLIVESSARATTCVDVLAAAVANSGIGIISADKLKSTTATATTISSSTSTSSSLSLLSTVVATTTTSTRESSLVTANEIVTNVSNKNSHNENIEQEFANNFNMDYLESFM